MATAQDIIEFDDGLVDGDRKFVSALARGLEILRAFRPGEAFLGNQDLARRTGLPKPTITRLTHTLRRLGYLGYSERLGKYHLGAGVMSLGYTLLANMDIRAVARPFMQELAEFSQGSVTLGVRDRLNAVYIENCRSSATVTLRLDVGARVPLAQTAIGRALLCGVPQAERERLLGAMRKQDTENWPRIQAGIEQAQHDIASRGFCLSIGEWQPDVNAVGAPLAIGEGVGTVAFNCGGPAFLLPRSRLEGELGPGLVALVRKVEAALGRR